MSPTWGQEYVLTLSCPEKPGIVHAVSGFMVQHSANIMASQQYGEAPDGRFFMRVHFAVPPGAQLLRLQGDFAQVAQAHQMSWQLHDAAARVRTLVMVSGLGHCLNDLLFRWKSGMLPANIVAVVSNHYDFGELAFSYNLPFRHIRVTPETKTAAEARLLQVIDECGAELVVLAR
jgi:formyltetrahydrofolate deformylase